MRRTRDHRILYLHWRPHCPKKPATSKRSELPGYLFSFLSKKYWAEFPCRISTSNQFFTERMKDLKMLDYDPCAGVPVVRKCVNQSEIKAQPATNCSLKVWKIWKMLIMILALDFFKSENVNGLSSFVFKKFQPMFFVQVREWVSYHRLPKSLFEVFLGSWYFFL